MVEPLVSIGLPVFNGEKYIGATIDSILAQTYSNFELIICDNASTDNTNVICQQYMLQDARVRHYTNDRNLGAAPNYRRVFHLSKGIYFKWAAHDDLLAPSYIQHCVHLLSSGKDIVLCHGLTKTIDADGYYIKSWNHNKELESHKISVRFNAVLNLGTNIFYVFGLINRKLLSQTRLLGDYPYHDLILLSELAIKGRLAVVNEELFLDRDHSERFTRKYNHVHRSARWFAPELKKKLIFPQWRLIGEYLTVACTASLPISERLRITFHIFKRAVKNIPHLLSDLLIAFEQVVPFFGPVTAKTIRTVKSLIFGRG